MSEQPNYRIPQQAQPAYPEGVMTPQESHAQRLADPQVVPVEAEAIEQAGPQPVKTVPVALPTGATVQVPMMSEWRQSAMDFMNAGDFESWAEKVLTPDDLNLWDEWRVTDPTLGETKAFFDAVGKATGELAAGNRALRRQSAHMQRR